MRRLCASLLLLTVAAPFTPAIAEDRLSLPEITAIVEKHLRRNPSYVAGDLISQGDMAPIFDELLSKGVRPADNEELYDSFLPDNNYLVLVLRSTSGRKFMRQVARLPGAYDRLERLSWTREGKALLKELIASPEGPKVFQSLTTPEGIKAMEEKLTGDPSGKNFGRPTGRIHTAEELLRRLSGTPRKPAESD